MVITRENQTGLIRNSNDTGASFNELAAEDLLVAYRIERQRIRLDREAEIEAREIESRGNSYPESLDNAIATANDFLAGEIRDKVLGAYLAPLANVLEIAEENRLRVQNFIAPEVKQDSCGISIESPLINYTFISTDCRPDGSREIQEKPFNPPPNSGLFTNDSDEYRKLFNSANVGKTFTLLWKFEGWCSEVFIKSSSSGGLVAWSSLTDAQANALIGANVVNILRFIPGNPNPAIVQVNSYIDVFNDARVSDGNFPDVIYPQQFPYNINNIGTHKRYAYRSTAKVINWQNFNTSFGVRKFFNLKINIRTDVSIGAGDFPVYGTTNSSGTFIPEPAIAQDFYLMQFFKGAYSNLPSDDFPARTANLTPPEILGSPIETPYKPPTIKPPPPPPRKKCECMANCCPQNQTDLSNLTRLLRLTLERVEQIEKKLGNTVDVPLWDVDITKRGSNSGNKKPDNLFNHLKLINERIELALRVIGIHEVPLDVDQNASDYTGTIKMFKQSGNAELKKLGETLEKRQKLRVTHTSVMSYLDWVADSIHEKFGDFELTVKMPSSDMVEEKMRGQEIYYPDISTAITAILQWTIDSNLNTQYSTMMLSKALIESTTIKKMLAETAFQVDATADYLGYGYKVEVEEMPTLITLEAGIEKLVELLAPGNVKVRKHVLDDKQTPLEVQLLKLHEVTAITKAVHTVPTGFGGRNIASVVKTLLQASRGLLGDDADSLEEYLDKLNKILGDDEDPLELEIAE